MTGIDTDLEVEIRRRLDASDDDGAATAAIRGYGPEILGYLTAILRDEDRADEAFATFSEDLWRGLPAFRADSTFRTWAYKLAWHAAARTAREPFRKKAVAFGTSAVSALAYEIRSATAPHLRTETKTAVQRLRDELKPDEQTLLILRVDRDLAWDEVADIMDLDAATVRKRFERVKDRLRTIARARGLLDE